MIFNIKVVNEDSSPISYKLAAKRTFNFLMTASLLGMGPYRPLFDENNQISYDRKLNLKVVNSKCD